MSEQGRFMVSFRDQASYDKYRTEVINSGGSIVHDQRLALSFTAIIPQTLLATMYAPSLDDNGIEIIEGDTVVTIQ